MECNEVFSVSRSTMLGRKHGLNAGGKKEVDRMLWNSPPVGSLQYPMDGVSNGHAGHWTNAASSNNRPTGQQQQHDIGAVRYRAHLQDDDDDEVPGSPVELCDVAVLKITDATTTSVGPSLSIVSSQVLPAADPGLMTSDGPAACVDAAGGSTEASRDSRRWRWFDLCHCDRHLIAIKLFYFTFIGALGVVISFAVVFLKQVGLSAFQIGVISGIRPMLGFISAPAWGTIADRFNIRRILMFVSMFAWLIFFSGLYFVEAPTRRERGHVYVGEQETTNVTTPPTLMTSRPNDSWSGTIVDVGLYVTGQNSSTPVTSWSTASSVAEVEAWSSNCVWNWTEDSGMLPAGEQERLREHLEWLYEPNSAYRVFIICLLIICGGEVFQSPTTAMSDAATLQILGRDQLDKYGAQRAWGSVGWAAGSLFTGAVLKSHRQSEVVCGVLLTFTDYRVVTYIFIAAFAVSLIAAIKINFATKKAVDADVNSKTGSGSHDAGNDATTKSDRKHNSLAVLRVFLNVRNGSWIFTVFFIGLCNGLIWGFLFWHLDNLGATQLMMGVDNVVACGFEFVAYFVVDYFVSLVGHAGIMYIGLLGYAIRFVVYASIRNPWTVLPVEALQGVTFAFTWVSMSQYTAISVPSVSLATVQGIIHGVYFGLGSGVGHLVGGLTIDQYGAPATYYAMSVVVVLWLLIFIACQKLSRQPVDQFAYQDMDKLDTNVDATSFTDASTPGRH